MGREGVGKIHPLPISGYCPGMKIFRTGGRQGGNELSQLRNASHTMEAAVILF
jgi:hypothetical protein